MDRPFVEDRLAGFSPAGAHAAVGPCAWPARSSAPRAPFGAWFAFQHSDQYPRARQSCSEFRSRKTRFSGALTQKTCSQGDTHVLQLELVDLRRKSFLFLLVDRLVWTTGRRPFSGGVCTFDGRLRENLGGPVPWLAASRSARNYLSHRHKCYGKTQRDETSAQEESCRVCIDDSWSRISKPSQVSEKTPLQPVTLK
jgi:hypothetical protein